MYPIKRFITKFYTIALIIIATLIVLIKFTPIDDDNYLYEYNKKIALLQHTDSPRIIFIGGSNLAFGLKSKIIEESLKHHVVNFGLHAGIGIRYLLEDALEYINKSDIVIVAAEYSNFFNGGYGNGETLTDLMLATNFRKMSLFNVQQWIEIIKKSAWFMCNSYYMSLKNQVKKKMGRPLYDYSQYNYIASGFNENGDEASHYKYKGEKIYESNERETRKVNEEFITWLDDILKKYEGKGARVYMMPPVCTQAVFKTVYNENIAVALKKINRPYLAEPSKIALPNKYNFDGGYHVDKEGAILNTNHILNALSFLLDQKKGST